MDHAREALAEDRARAFHTRAAKARGWARLAYALLVGVFLFAAWQDRRLAPPVHDGMQATAGRVARAAEHSDEVRAWLKGLFGGPSGSGAKSEYDPITRWLLQWQR